MRIRVLMVRGTQPGSVYQPSRVERLERVEVWPTHLWPAPLLDRISGSPVQVGRSPLTDGKCEVMIVVMLYVLSGTTNTQTGTHKETGAQPDPLLCLCKQWGRRTQKQYLFFRGKFSACWCSDEYRPTKQILIDWAQRSGAQTCVNCILIQSRCTAFSEGKLIVNLSVGRQYNSRDKPYLWVHYSQWGLPHSQANKL